MTKTELLSTYTKDRLAEMVLELQVAAGLRYDKIQMLKWEVSNLENMIGGLREIIGTYKNGILPRCTKQAKEAIDNDCFEKVMVVTCREWSDKPGKEENQPDIRKFEAKIDSLQSEVEKYRKALEVEKEKRECQISEYQKKIEDLTAENKSGYVSLRQDPIDIAGDLIKAFCWQGKEYLPLECMELRQIAEHLLVYCNHNGEAEE